MTRGSGKRVELRFQTVVLLHHAAVRAQERLQALDLHVLSGDHFLQLVHLRLQHLHLVGVIDGPRRSDALVLDAPARVVVVMRHRAKLVVLVLRPCRPALGHAWMSVRNLHLHM